MYVVDQLLFLEFLEFMFGIGRKEEEMMGFQSVFNRLASSAMEQLATANRQPSSTASMHCGT